jgi:hypothetical protein
MIVLPRRSGIDVSSSREVPVSSVTSGASGHSYASSLSETRRARSGRIRRALADDRELVADRYGDVAERRGSLSLVARPARCKTWAKARSRMIRFRSGLAVALLATAAAAEQPYPGAFIDRPLVLPPGMLQPHAGWELLGFRGGPTRNSIGFGADVGVFRDFQIGASAVLTEAPDLGFDRVAARGLIALHPAAAVRVDTSIYRFLGVPQEYGYASGIGLSIKIPLVPGTLALISGRSFALPPIGRTEELHFADDLFTLDLNHSNVTATLGIPMGLELQAIPQLSLLLRSGYRHGFGGGLYSEDWVPVGLDVLVNLAPVDLIASAELPGNLRGHTDIFVLRAAVQARF